MNWKLVQIGLLFPTILVAASASQYQARYLNNGPGSQSQVLAADTAGNLFVASTVVESSGRPQIRVTKTDAQGNELAHLDFGGSNPDAASSAAVDPQGNLILVGTTESPDFPVNTHLVSQVGQLAAFITKFDSQLKGIVFSTVLGGTQGGLTPGGTSGNAVAVDAGGNIYLTGSTSAADFPVTPGAFQTKPPSGSILGSPSYAYLTEISANGSGIIYSTFFGGDSTVCVGGSRCIGVYAGTGAGSIAIDSQGSVVIAGNTTANDLPVTAGVLGPQCLCTNLVAGFIAKFTAGRKLAWATYIPLSTAQMDNFDYSITAMALDSSGNVVIGGTAPAGLSVTPGALQTALPNFSSDGGFVSKIDPLAQRYIFSTYLGANMAPDNGINSLAIDAEGTIWTTGRSDPGGLPLPPSVPVLGSTYVAGLSSDGSTLIDAVTAPRGAAGQSIVITAQGNVAALGLNTSLLVSATTPGPSLVALANSATFQVSGEVSPRELISFYGVGIGPSPAQGGQVVAGVFTNKLGGVQVLFDGVPAPLLYAGPNQINAVVPAGVDGRSTTAVQIVTPGGTLSGLSLPIVPSNPEVFGNTSPLLALVLNQDGSVNSSTNPAPGGSIVTIWATGAGISDQTSRADGSIISSNLGFPLLPVSVIHTLGLGGDSLEVLYAGDAPGQVSGVMQVNFRLPPFRYSQSFPVICQLQVGAASSGSFYVYEQD
jgi:uncharacterized protein (TIGR03437 family)